MCWVAFLLLFSKILSLPLILNTLMCLGAISFSLSYFELTKPLGYVNWCFSYNLGRFLATFSLNIFPSLSLISLFSESLFMVACLMMSHRFPRLYSFFSILNWKITIDLSSSSLILQICSWAPLVNFSLQLLHFSTTEFLFVFSFLNTIWWDIFYIFSFLNYVLIQWIHLK